MTLRSSDKLSQILRFALDRYVTKTISDGFKLNIGALKVMLIIMTTVGTSEGATHALNNTAYAVCTLFLIIIFGQI